LPETRHGGFPSRLLEIKRSLGRGSITHVHRPIRVIHASAYDLVIEDQNTPHWSLAMLQGFLTLKVPVSQTRKKGES
jgi:hypothetical protein